MSDETAPSRADEPYEPPAAEEVEATCFETETASMVTTGSVTRL